jgi:hypothetical protein
LFRDKTPLTNLGFGVTSRDIPEASDEKEKPSPNSGLLSKALHDKPVLKYISTMAATMAGAMVLQKGFQKGGLKLAKTIQNSADNGSHLGTRIVKGATQIRKTLDELEGLNRVIENVDDPYSRLIFENPDKTIIKAETNRLGGPGFVSDGTMWMTESEFRAARTGKEPVAVWSFRDELQSKLVRNTRSLGTMLPATYVTQRGITDPLFGNQDESQKKVKWYNPVDVVTDFVKQSTINITSMILPQSAAGAGIARTKFLASAPYQDFPLPLSKNQYKTAHKIADVKTILSSFGQDAGELFNKANRISASASYAFNNSYQEAAKKDGGLVFSLHQARRGAKAARVAAENSSVGKGNAALDFAKRNFAVAKGYMFGYKNQTGSPIDLGATKSGISNVLDPNDATLGFLDVVPSLRGVTSRSKTV